jgi:hypothetical protein
MSDNLPYILEDETETLTQGEWFDDLDWSPSQCYYHLQHDGVDYILYLRWRWTNPWQAYVVRNTARIDAMNEDEVIWSGDVFEVHHVYYDDVELDLAKNKIISLFYEFDGHFPELREILQEYEENSRRESRRELFFHLSSNKEIASRPSAPPGNDNINRSANSYPLLLPRR